uniref:NADH dehydrogenase subunit 4 n=1 Tax=Neoseiulus californicus TaxID=84382 RepID=UPI0022DCE07B|nr:NADH dehydrogenase subunit 4 [Neoseiulus californicus]UZU69615.1 NADH dehydrogenase subunit 4 [Neoseiulus californicus]WJN56895.1 NADH dehydrogenase subunit 4 [Neoseiulus californicus]WKV28865.1 NADH dehydrogenase subunit 4 [Neoseiulus californicus]
MSSVNLFIIIAYYLCKKKYMMMFFMLFVYSFYLANFVLYLKEVDYFNFDFLVLFYDYLSFLMVSLSYFIVLFIFLLKKKNNNLILFSMLSIMFVFLKFSFFMNSLLNFYLFFEFCMIPLMILILIMGSSVERFISVMYMLLYTMLGSLIFLSLILLMSKSIFISLEKSVFFYKNSGYLWILMFMVFLVKIPFFSFHFWLPKAHVEGPVSCSMLLAGILLKLGGFGLIRLGLFLSMNSLKLFMNVIMLFSMVGALIVSVVCVFQVDIKLLIAYSSISHMGLMLSGLLSGSQMGSMFGVMMMLSHGFCSSGLFFLGNMFYLRCKSRNMFMYKNILIYSPVFSTLWMLMVVFNMGTPPSMNFFSEIYLLVVLLNKSILFMILFLIIMLISVYYSLNLFLRSGQGLSWDLNFFKKETFMELFISLGHIMFLLICLFNFKLFLI